MIEKINNGAAKAGAALARLYVWIRSNGFGVGRSVGLATRIHDALAGLSEVASGDDLEAVRRYAKRLSMGQPELFLSIVEMERDRIRASGFEAWRYDDEL
jgi:hypothetical protein